jgi:hypothetical protein
MVHDEKEEGKETFLINQSIKMQVIDGTWRK